MKPRNKPSKPLEKKFEYFSPTSWTWEELPQTSACKHGLGSCYECGTTNTRDRIHTTKRGKGVVGRIK